MKMVGYLGLVAFIFILVFTHQTWVLAFLSSSEWTTKALAAGVIFLFVPLFAYIYSNVTRSLMKLIRME